MKGSRFDSIADIQKAVADLLKTIPKQDLFADMKKLKTRAEKCIAMSHANFE